ncbi:hypothetical protein B0H15DRAFT_756312, partial [Mycena belliarum]
EALAHETSCYLFIAAHHMHATEPFIHYSSPRILRDGKTEIQEITNSFNQLFHTFKNAK